MRCTCSSNQIIHTLNQQGPQMKWEQDHPVDWHQDLRGCVCVYVRRNCGAPASGVLLAYTGPAFPLLQASCLIWFHFEAIMREWQSDWVSILHTQTCTAPPACWLLSSDRYTSFPHQTPDNEMTSRPVDTMSLCKTVNKTRLFSIFYINPIVGILPSTAVHYSSYSYTPSTPNWPTYILLQPQHAVLAMFSWLAVTVGAAHKQ